MRIADPEDEYCTATETIDGFGTKAACTGTSELLPLSAITVGIADRVLELLARAEVVTSRGKTTECTGAPEVILWPAAKVGKAVAVANGTFSIATWGGEVCACAAEETESVQIAARTKIPDSPRSPAIKFGCTLVKASICPRNAVCTRLSPSFDCGSTVDACPAFRLPEVGPSGFELLRIARVPKPGTNV